MSALDQQVMLELRASRVAFVCEDDGALRIPAINEEVGDLLIAFDGGEVTVFVGNFTHAHFRPYPADDDNAAFTQSDCASGASDMIRCIVEGRWLIWAYPNGLGGCYEIGTEGTGTADEPVLNSEVTYYQWSGRVERAV
jgi:hypothetical protein